MLISEEYQFIIQQGMKVMEVYNPVTQAKIIIMYTEYQPTSSGTLASVDYLSVTGVDITNFLEKNKIISRADIGNTFASAFTGYLQQHIAVQFRFSSHFPYVIVS